MKRQWQIANILSLVFALVANFLVGAQILDVPAIGEISSKYATVLTPATYAFSIWSLIYLLLVAFVVYQARDIFKSKSANKLPEQVGPWFVIASICNGLWTYVFVSEMIGLSVLLLLLLTVSLFIILARLDIATANPPLKTIAFVWWPLMIYAGWVTVASVVNIASWLEYLQFSVTPLFAHVVLVALGAILITLLIMRNLRELLLACIWGIIAIGVEQVNSVGVTAFTVAGILAVAVVVHAYLNRRANLISYILAPSAK